MTSLRRERVLVFLALCLSSAVIFGGTSLARLSTDCIPTCEWDPNLYVWMFAWFRRALLLGLNPFRSSLIGGPSGVPLHWTTTVTAPAALGLPLTGLVGARASVNVLVLLGPALAGWCAYLLCREVTARRWPSIVGGLTFGFSSYTAFELFQLNLLLVFLLPLAALLVLRLLRGSIAPRPFVLAMTSLLVLQFFTSIEVFATLALFGALALACHLLWEPRAVRTRVLRRALPIVAAYAMTAIVVSPYLLTMLRTAPESAWADITPRSAELLEWAIPSRFSLLGVWFDRIRDLFGIDTAVPTSAPQAYLGLPLLGLLVSAWRRPERYPRFLLAFAVLAALFTMGPRIQVGRWLGIPGPYALLAHVPLLEHAFPKRFAVYVWLVAAVIVAQWLANVPRAAWHRAALLVAIGAVVLMPATSRLGPGGRLEADARPVAFTSGAYRWFIGPDEGVLALSTMSTEILWQVETDFGFRLAEGYLGPYAPWGIAPAHTSSPAPASDASFRRFCLDMGVDWVVMPTGVWSRWRPMLERVSGLPPIRFGGVDFYRVRDRERPEVAASTAVRDGLVAGETLMRGRRLTDAAAEFRGVLRLDPMNRHAHLRLAQIYFEYGVSNFAEAHIRATLSSDPHWTPGLLALARFWVIEGRSALADRIFLRIAALDASVLTAEERARAVASVSVSRSGS